eukprot:655038-Pyramimonas_sp.AAC.1
MPGGPPAPTSGMLGVRVLGVLGPRREHAACAPAADTRADRPTAGCTPPDCNNAAPGVGGAGVVERSARCRLSGVFSAESPSK